MNRHVVFLTTVPTSGVRTTNVAFNLRRLYIFTLVEQPN